MSFGFRLEDTTLRRDQRGHASVIRRDENDFALSRSAKRYQTPPRPRLSRSTTNGNKVEAVWYELVINQASGWLSGISYLQKLAEDL